MQPGFSDSQVILFNDEMSSNFGVWAGMGYYIFFSELGGCAPGVLHIVQST